MQPKWETPQRFGPDEPTSPYAHWWVKTQPGRARCYMRVTATTRKDVAVEMHLLEPADAPGPRSAEMQVLQPADERVPSDHARWKLGDNLFGLDDCLIASVLSRDTVNRRYDPAAPVAGKGKPPTSETVYVAIIDDGIAFAHERFRSGPTEDALRLRLAAGRAQRRRGPPAPAVRPRVPP